MRKLICLLLTLLFLPIVPVMAESPVLAIGTPAETIRPGKAFLLSFSVPSAGVCDLQLRSMTGEPVMDVVTGLNVAAGVNQMWWNGTTGGISPAEGAYQLAVIMDGAEAVCTVIIGDYAPYLTSIVPAKNAQNHTLTVDFYASVEGLLSVGLWSGNIWTLLENRQISAGMNQFAWDASDMPENTDALTLTLTDQTGFCSNEERIPVTPEELGVSFATPVPEAAATPEPVEAVLTPIIEAEQEAADEDAQAETEVDAEFSGQLDISLTDLVAEEIIPEAVPTPVPTPTPEPIVYTPSYGSPYELTAADEGTFWGTPMDIADAEAVWAMLTAPITVYDADYRGQKKIYAEPDEDSRTVAVITGTSQGVRVIEHRDDGWSLIETYSSTFHDNSIQAWNMLVQGYVRTSMLETKTVNKKYHIVVDKLTQRLYLFGDGECLATLLVSTGLSNERQPYNETRSGEFLYISATGGFKSDNMVCPMGMKFNDGDLLHEVPYIQRSEGGTKIYSATEPELGTRASHGCIRVQRKKNPDGYNMKWIWDNRKDVGRIVIWEDWQGRQLDYPADDTLLYYNPNGGSYYHSADHCNSAKDSVAFTAFTYAELDEGEFAELEFCPYCVPMLRKAEIDAINTAHTEGGDHDPVLTEARQKYLNKVVDKHGLDALTEGEMRYYQPELTE